MVYEQGTDIGPAVTLYTHHGHRQYNLNYAGLYLAHIKSILGLYFEIFSLYVPRQ